MNSPRGLGNRPTLLLIGICAVTFIVYLDTSITPVALPAIVADLGGGDTAAQWILDAYTLAFACLLLAGGLLGDRLGSRRVLLGGTLLFTVASVACALATGMGMLVAGRALQGVAAAAIVPLSVTALSTHITEPSARARAIGIWGGTAGIALAVGPVLGGVLVTTTGWRGLFWVNIPVGIAAWYMLRRALQRGTSATSRSLDVPGQVLFVLAGCSVTLVLIEGPHRGWTSSVVFAGIATTVIAGLALTVWESRTPRPLLPPALLRIREVAVACVVNFFGLFGLYGVLFVLTVYFQKDLGLSPVETGLRFLPLFGMLGVASLTASSVVNRRGVRTTMITGLVLNCVGLIGLVGIPLEAPAFVYLAALGMVGSGIPLSGGVVAIQAMTAVVPGRQLGAASGAMNTCRQFGAVFGVAVAALVSPVVGNTVTHLSATFLIAAAGAALGAAVTGLALRPRSLQHHVGAIPEPIHSETP